MLRENESSNTHSSDNREVSRQNALTQSVAECGGTATLALAIVGSGAHATQLTDSGALALLINAVVTAAVLGVLIAALLPVSGAHFNPAVTLVMLIRRDISVARGTGFALAQFAGAIGGTVLAHWLFTKSAPTFSTSDRAAPVTMVAEVIATAGLVFLIVTAIIRGAPSHIPLWVALWIGAGYFVTPSTGFANPAITIGRIFTDTFTGIATVSALWFIAAQIIGALVGLGLAISLGTSRNRGKTRR